MTAEDFIAFYPTAVALIIGLLAIFITFQPVATVKSKIIWLIVFSALTITAIIAGFWQQSITGRKENANNLKQAQRDSALTQRDKEFAFLQGQMTSLIKLTATSPPSTEETKRLSMAIGTLEKMIEKTTGQKSTKSLQTFTNIQIPLKTRALLLSSQILKFIGNRSNTPLPKSETWAADTRRMLDFLDETMNLYSIQFASKVISIRNELAENGFEDRELNSNYERPTNPIGVRIVGERIGALAERLP